MKSLEQKIIVRCKNCGWRIFDKVTMTTGVIELKCPNCHRVHRYRQDKNQANHNEGRLSLCCH